MGPIKPSLHTFMEYIYERGLDCQDCDHYECHKERHGMEGGFFETLCECLETDPCNCPGVGNLLDELAEEYFGK